VFEKQNVPQTTATELAMVLWHEVCPLAPWRGRKHLFEVSDSPGDPEDSVNRNMIPTGKPH